MNKKLLLIILDGVPWRNWRRLFGNMEGWVDNGDARVWKMRSVLPSTSACCYASIHTGVVPAVHGCTGNYDVRRLDIPDIFSQVRSSGGVTGAVTYQGWSEFFNRAPFDPVRDIEYDEPESDSINHGRFHSMTGYDLLNSATPADADLYATLTMLTERFGLNYGLLHTVTLDCMGHQYGHDTIEYERLCYKADEQLAPYVRRWRNAGYEVIVTADHGQSDPGHHGGRGEEMQDVALYYFGDAEGPAEDVLLRQTQLAPTVLKLLGADIPETMKDDPFLG